MERKETKYNKVVNFDEETKEITVLDYTFNHGDGFKGATGSIFYAVSKSEFDKTLEPYLDDKEELLCYMADNFGNLSSDTIRGVDASEEALKDLFFDTSYSEIWDYLREATGLNEEQAYIFNCSGGGRCFDKDFNGNVNVELSQIIRDFENR
jgi:hypothetical protein